MIDVVREIGAAVIRYLRFDWWILLLGISIAVLTRVYLGEKLEIWMKRRSGASIFGSIGFGAFTPLCACGTMAVILSMFVTSLPWGAVMAFLVVSPLTSPIQFIFQSGFLGIRLAVAGMASAILLGLGAGYLASYLEQRTSFFNDQYRLKPVSCQSCTAAASAESCCSIPAPGETLWQRWKLGEVVTQTYELGVKRVLLLFIIFIAAGQLVEMFIPTQLILGLFSPGASYSVPLAALIGLPLYVSGSAGLPLLESFLNAGASEAAVLAFLIAGQGTSVGVMVGISSFLKKRAISFYVAFVLVGGILSGYVYQVLAG